LTTFKNKWQSKLLGQERGTEREPGPPALPGFPLFSPAGQVYIVSFRNHNDDRPSKFIVLGRQYEIRHQDGLGAWRGGFSIEV
jgi:hypothetical protein